MANDTDIFMKSVYFITQLDDLHELWVKEMNYYSPVHGITDALAVKYAVEPAAITSILLSTYILTVSYLYRRWKRRAYKATIDRLQELQPLAKYGNDSEGLNVQDSVISSARLYVMALYDRNNFEGNLDALRAHMFGNIKGGMRPLFFAYILFSLVSSVMLFSSSLVSLDIKPDCKW